MATTLRLDDDDDARPERLAARWGIGKLRAIRESDAVVVADEGVATDAEALDRLGPV